MSATALTRRGMLAGAIAGLAGGAAAQAGFPQRPIELVVAYPAGGGMDITARTFAREAERILGWQFRVQNRVGGAGLVGHTWMAKSAPADGHAVGMTANPFFFLDFMTREGAFSAADVRPIAGINFSPILWVTRRDSPLGALDFAGVIAEARRRPGELRIGVIPNNAFQFVTEIAERALGVRFTHVPFQGGRPAVTALLGGTIELTNCFYEEVDQQLRTGELVPLAISDDRPFEPLPQVPPMPAVGVPMPGGVWGANRFAIVPRAVPDALAAQLEQAFLRVLGEAEAVEAFRRAGILLRPKPAAAVAAEFAVTERTLAEFLRATGRPLRL